MLAVLRHSDFRYLWLGQSASAIGDRIVFVVLALFVTDIGTPTDVGLVLGANALALVAFLLVGGVWADRLPRHRVMIGTDLVRAVVHGIVALLIVTDAIEVWHLLITEAIAGAAEAFFRPAYTGLVPQTVPEDRLQEANAVNGFVANLAEFLGPALGTALILGLGAEVAFALDAATYLVSALLLMQVRPRPRGDRAPREGTLAELRAGYEQVRSRAWVWVTIATTAVALLTALAPFFTLGPTVAEAVYGDQGAYGLSLAALGAGTLAGAFAGLRWRPRYPLRAGFAWVLPWPACIGLFALGPPVALLVVAWAIAGIGLALFIVWWETALAERIPPRLLSRVSSFDWMGSLALLPLGYLIAGPLGEALGPREVLVAGAAIAFSVSLAGLAVPQVWRLQNSATPSSGVEASA